MNMWNFHSFLWDSDSCWQIQIKEKEWGGCTICTYGACWRTDILWSEVVGLKYNLMTKELLCVIKYKDTASASESTWAENCCKLRKWPGKRSQHYCPAIAWFFPHHLHLVTLKAGYRTGLTISWALYICYHVPYSVIHVSNTWGPIL